MALVLVIETSNIQPPKSAKMQRVRDNVTPETAEHKKSKKKYWKNGGT
jgi:hypothetical protein